MSVSSATAPNHTAPRRGLLLLALSLALPLITLLVACTGTSEPRPPTMLVVGVESAGTPALLLLEDVTESAPPGDPRLEVLAGSTRNLQAPAVAFDVEDRGLTRPALWVLAREVANVGGTPQVSAYLQRFTVDGVDPQAPAGFAEDVSARVVLSEPGGSGVLDGLSLTSPFSCPTAVQVDREGSWPWCSTIPGPVALPTITSSGYCHLPVARRHEPYREPTTSLRCPPT